MDALALIRRASAPAPPRAEERTLTRASAAPLLALGDERLSVDRALGLGDVYACVRAIAESAASLPLHVYRRTDAGRVRVTSGRLAELLGRPAPAVTTQALVGTAVAHLALRGNCYLGKYRDASGRIVQLAPLPPEQVQVKIEQGAPVYELHRPEGVTRHGPADVLHVRMPLSLDGILGLSPIAATRHALPLAESLATLAHSFAENAGRPSGMLKASGHLGPEQASRLREAFSARHGGAKHAGGVLVVEGELEWTPLSLALEDAQFIEQRRLSTAEVARIFRVPPWMIGAPSGDSMTYSNVHEQAASFVRFTLAPYLTAIERALSADADLAPGALYVEFTLDGLLRADPKTRAEVYRLALDPATGWMSRAEVRALENLAPEQEGIA